MSKPAIEVVDLSKRYIIDQVRNKNDDLRHALDRIMRSPWRWLRMLGAGQPSAKEEFWALRDVNIQIAPGEVVGIIGRNGAGKSTLLKLLSRITEPTKGRIKIRGRVASLLEVGTGFHPELSGRENIFLNGAILGMTRAEIRRKFDDIVSFAEIQKFIDTPVKRYSSGMYVRLAFAVAAHLEPEILIVDEVLAVGDLAFQRKCLGKMSEVAHGGRAILFVSHNMGVVSALCQRVVLLENGSVTESGDAETVIRRYMRNIEIGTSTENVRSASGKVTLLRAMTVDSEGHERRQFSTAEPVQVVIDFQIHEHAPSVISPVIDICNDFGDTIFSTANFNERGWYAESTRPGTYRSVCDIPGNLFNDQSYVVCILFVEHLRDVLLRVEAVRLDIIDAGDFRDLYNGPVGGMLRPPCRWQTGDRVEDAPGGRLLPVQGEV